MAPRDQIKKYSILIYFVLTLIISWGSLLLIMGMRGILGTTVVPEEKMPLLYIGMLLGPSIAGLMMTGFTKGRSGFRELFSKLGLWRINIKWYSIAILTAPISVMGVLLFLSQFSSKYIPDIFTLNDRFSLFASGIFAGILVGVFEELGWTGFAIPKLRLKYNALVTGLIVGFVWGLWHMPLFIASARTSQEIAPLFALVAMLFTFLPAYRVLMVHVYDYTKSLFIAIIMHASQTATTLIFAIPGGDVPIVISNIIYGALLWLFVLIIFEYTRYSK